MIRIKSNPCDYDWPEKQCTLPSELLYVFDLNTDCRTTFLNNLFDSFCPSSPRVTKWTPDRHNFHRQISFDEVAAMEQPTLIDAPLIGAIDQGTGSTRFLLFRSDNFTPVASASKPTTPKVPERNWLQMDPMEILQTTIDCIQYACEKLYKPDIRAIGLTNQRETIILWDKETGRPLYDAIVWSDNRTEEQAETMNQTLSDDVKRRVKSKTGLPIHPYFSALKIRWLLENVPQVRCAVDAKKCFAGTVDSWLIWNLTGGIKDGIHVTDVSNASRTLLMDLKTLQWDSELLDLFGIPIHILPTIRSSSEMYGNVYIKAIGRQVPLCGCLGDQQAALVGQLCHHPGDVKCTYGTGCFLLRNTGTTPVFSNHGLLTTVAYQLGQSGSPCYALEGSVAVSGGLVQWVRDNLGLIESSEQIEQLASSVTDTGDVYFVPAFSGLYAPYWEPAARGTICGLTQSTNKGHLARACLEAVCFQINDILEAMEADHNTASFKRLRVDGKMVENNLLMQMQADLAAITVLRPMMFEATALGAALMAATHVKCYSFDQNRSILPNTENYKTFEPIIGAAIRQQRVTRWRKAVEKSMGWVEAPGTVQCTIDRQTTLTENNILASCALSAMGGFCLMFVMCRYFCK